MSDVKCKKCSRKVEPGQTLVANKTLGCEMECTQRQDGMHGIMVLSSKKWKAKVAILKIILSLIGNLKAFGKVICTCQTEPVSGHVQKTTKDVSVHETPVIE